MVSCLLGLGSNLGDRVGNLLSALEELRRHPAIQVASVSSFFETTPVGGPPGQANFFNAAAIVSTTLTPTELLSALLEIEKKLGRQRSQTWGSRTIDLDLLLSGDTVIETPEIAVPHPRMHERRFVLAPAAEIAGDWRHPLRHQTIGQILASLPAESPGSIGMRVILSPSEMRSAVMMLRREGRRIAVVPTMGALHEGHLSLVRIARQRADVVVATIFVNPTQFGPSEDFVKYPRTLEADLQALSAAGCDLVFLPSVVDIYPLGFSTYVEPPAVAQPFEGACRPGHFRGVATVVLKLFHLVPADLACFGLKDFQQLLVIRRMVQDLALPIEIVSCPTVREPDGLAISSRNRYLSPVERQQAAALPRALDLAERLAASGEKNSVAIVTEMRRILSQGGISRIDYVALADPQSLAEKTVVDGAAVALIAAYAGTTRLIDNRLIHTS
jgi:pantoate--beta-alanine ligase